MLIEELRKQQEEEELAIRIDTEQSQRITEPSNTFNIPFEGKKD